MSVIIIEAVGAALLLFGSFIILWSVWETDHEPDEARVPMARQEPERDYRRAA